VKPRRLPLWKKLLFALLPLLASLLVAEIVTRLVRGPLYFESFRLLRIDQVRRGYPAVRDPVLGYAPRPGAATEDSRWGTRVTIDAAGCRSNGQPRPPGPRIVAVGDSFTFGDQVDDEASWPAALERELGQPVVNGGVFGYSLGQAVLRAEQLLASEPAEWLVVGLFGDDVFRNEYSKRYSPIPYFDVVDGALAVHLPGEGEAIDAEEQAARAFKNLLGHSALLDAVLGNLAKDWWINDEKLVRALPEGRGLPASLLLIDRIATFCAARGCRLAVLLIADVGGEPGRAALARAGERGALTVDLPAILAAERTGDPDLQARLFDGHLTAAGNAWAARHLAAALRSAR
jgi:hypothetical protein